MKVLMVIPFVSYMGGMERQGLRLSRELMRQGVDVEVATFERIGTRYDQDIRNEVGDLRLTVLWGVFALNRLWPADMLFALRWFLRGRDFDVIHAHKFHSAGLVASQLRNIVGIPVVVKAAGGGEHGDLKLLERFAWFKKKLAVLRRADAIIALTPEILDELKGVGFSDDQVISIPNGIDSDFFEYRNPGDMSAARDRLGFGDRSVVLVNSRIAPQKNIKGVVEVARILRDRGVDVEFRVLSAEDSGARESGVLSLVAQYDLGDRVLFEGRVSADRVRDYYVASDVFFLYSLSEGLSNALLESLAVGLPVVVSDIAGNRAVVKDGVEALMVDPNNYEAAADAIEKVFSDRDLVADMTLKGRKCIEERYALSSVAAKYIELYLKLVG